MKRVALLMLACVWLLQTQTLGQAPAIQGVWKVVAVTAGGKTNAAPQPALYMFSKGYYSVIQVNGDKPRPRLTGGAKSATADQLLAVYGDSFHANAGTYKVTASSLITYPIVAKSPGSMASDSFLAFTFKLSDKRLTLTTDRTATGSTTDRTVYQLERLE